MLKWTTTLSRAIHFTHTHYTKHPTLPNNFLSSSVNYFVNTQAPAGRRNSNTRLVLSDYKLAACIPYKLAGSSIESWVLVTHSIRQGQSNHIRIVWSSRASHIDRMTIPAEILNSKSLSRRNTHLRINRSFYLDLPYRYRATQLALQRFYHTDTAQLYVT